MKKIINSNKKVKDKSKTVKNKSQDNIAELQNKFLNLGVLIPEILLPKKGIDLKKWSVVACDQYTSQEDYWDNVEKFVGQNYSTLKITLPEIYLENNDVTKRIKNINSEMQKYLKEKILVSQKPGFIFVDRSTNHTKSRKGLIVALDLEKYDFTKGSKTLIRATEGTVVERLPPRIKIREKASIELPHIMVLIDDPKMTVIEPLQNSKLEKVYDFDLMMNSGHIKGFLVNKPNDINKVYSALEKLSDKKSFYEKYNLKKDEPVLLFAMGDGNHSLATAKKIWEEKKKNLEPKYKNVHPARFALVELVNVHDPGLKFEPIHRVVFNAPKDIFDKMKKYYSDNGSSFEFVKGTKEPKINSKKAHIIKYVYGKDKGFIVINNPKLNLEVGSLQAFLDYLVKNDKNVKIDYIHGDEVVCELGSKQGNIGFLLPIMQKTELFRTVILDGVLPRKTFSMGHADEKRFYLEARKIV